MFKNSVGKAALAFFVMRGKMVHDTDAKIIGTDPEDEEFTLESSMNRLVRAIDAFESWEEKFAPHFAYGQLSKEQYTKAHLLHINSHLDSFGKKDYDKDKDEDKEEE